MSSSGHLGDIEELQGDFSRQRNAQFRYFITGVLALVATGLAWPFLGRGLATMEFMPHTLCYLGNRTLIGTHLTADLLIGISYVVISLTLLYLVRASKGGIPFHWMFLAFGTFIIACGATHFMEAITLWHPVYWISAYVKVVTAVASVATAVALPLVMPNVVGTIANARHSEDRRVALMKANDDLIAANDKLQDLDRLRRRFVAQTAANIGDWDWDISAGKVRWSEEVEAMHGFAPGAFRGSFEEWVSTIHPDERTLVSTAAMTAVANRSEYEVEYRTVRPDGSYYWTAARGAVECDSAGKPVRMVGMCMDISNRKRTEETLRKTEKLAAAGRLAATISHEINNPLEAVTNLLFLAKVESTQESCKQLLDLADQELRRVSHIARQTLGFYRDNSTPAALDLGQTMREVVNIFHGKLSSRNVEVRIEQTKAMQIFGLAGELRQLFSNLLSNAVDASPANFQITIRLRDLGAFAQVTVADIGSGIPEAARAQIFEPFFTTKKDVGTGLGLWISKQIAEKHGGTLRFKSSTRAGRSGTVFVVRLQKDAMERNRAA
jgi:PAS domain S-box-containing protein